MVEKPPAAVQAVAALHDTPVKIANVVPVGFGGVLSVQLVPFQTSVSSLFAWNAPVALENPPTVTHAVDEAQDTAFSVLKVSPEAAWVVFTVQLVPSHRSASLTQ